MTAFWPSLIMVFSLDALLERGLDEGVEVAVQHLLGVGDLDVGAQVLDAALVQHVAADLVAPADVGLVVFQLLLRFHALAHLEVVQPRAQALPRDVAVAVLAAAVLALHDDVGRDVRQAHRRIGLVDVLATRARSTVGVHAHVGRVDVDLDRVVDLGIDEHAGEAGVAPARGVERRLPHQPVHAGLGAQQAERVVALDLERGALDPRHVTGGLVLDRVLEALALGVLDVLAHEHAGPVARLGAAGAGLQVQEAVARVRRLVEHAPELEVLHDGLELAGLGLDRLQARLVPVLLAHFVELEVVGQLAVQVLDGQDDAIELLLFLAQLLGLLGVVPDRGVFQRGGDGSQALRFGIEVKDTSGDQPSGPAGPAGWCRSGWCVLRPFFLDPWVNLRFCHFPPPGAGLGSERMNSEPSPGALRTSSRPWCACAIWRAMYRPSPRPATCAAPSVRSNCSKMRSWSTGAMPMPWSRTDTNASSPSSRRPTVTATGRPWP